MKKSLIAIITLFIIIILLINVLPRVDNSYIKQGNLYISKILAVNKTVLTDNNGEYSDYIVIYNGYNTDINLNNYHLTDSEYLIDKWTFPEIIIKPKESLIIFATGNDTCDLVNRVCHTNFKLSSHGEVLTLSDKTGNIISKFSYPEQYPDTFYGYYQGKYTYLSTDNKPIKKAVSNINYELEITEYMTHNKRSLHDIYGNYFDWIEIHNKSNDDYILENVYLSDDKTNLRKYELPQVTILKDAYLIIYLTKENVAYDSGIYANFGLSDDDKEIIISNGNKIIDCVPIVKLVDNVSYGKTDDGWRYFTTATPGKVNNTASFKEWGDNLGNT